MINKDKFKKIAERIFHSKQGIRNPNIMNPEREWSTGLIIGFTIFFITTVWSTQTYLSNRDVGEIENITEDNGVMIYRKSTVDAALEIYPAREIKLKQLLDNGYLSIETLTENEIDVSKASSTDSINEEADESEDESVESPEEEVTGDGVDAETQEPEEIFLEG